MGERIIYHALMTKHASGDPPFILNPGQTSPEVQNRAVRESRKDCQRFINLYKKVKHRLSLEMFNENLNRCLQENHSFTLALQFTKNVLRAKEGVCHTFLTPRKTV